MWSYVLANSFYGRTSADDFRRFVEYQEKCLANSGTSEIVRAHLISYLSVKV